ncbi:hypothetical protein HY440_02150 [Candidatus Microgenomates bacterium]|nr:hypothetical protein [Candidatus Microgenomates bacterium]
MINIAERFPRLKNRFIAGGAAWAIGSTVSSATVAAPVAQMVAEDVDLALKPLIWYGVTKGVALACFAYGFARPEHVDRVAPVIQRKRQAIVKWFSSVLI